MKYNLLCIPLYQKQEIKSSNTIIKTVVRIALSSVRNHELTGKNLSLFAYRITGQQNQQFHRNQFFFSYNIFNCCFDVHVKGPHRPLKKENDRNQGHCIRIIVPYYTRMIFQFLQSSGCPPPATQNLSMFMHGREFRCKLF